MPSTASAPVSSCTAFTKKQRWLGSNVIVPSIKKPKAVTISPWVCSSAVSKSKICSASFCSCGNSS
uniref:Uncharacterized protein n=1 Tax=Siphoviridae sp. ct3o911 TaxID=2827560 RepID=A0A8S5LK27_9CAUD|nr:MAG TPA: hypothetical protein [Siphoviridae sp. ct3o911]